MIIVLLLISFSFCIKRFPLCVNSVQIILFLKLIFGLVFQVYMRCLSWILAVSSLTLGNYQKLKMLLRSKWRKNSYLLTLWIGFEHQEPNYKWHSDPSFVLCKYCILFIVWRLDDLYYIEYLFSLFPQVRCCFSESKIKSSSCMKE